MKLHPCLARLVLQRGGSPPQNFEAFRRELRSSVEGRVLA